MSISNQSNDREQQLAYKKITILGVSFLVAGFRQTVEWIESGVLLGKRTFVITANPETVMSARSNPDMSRAVQKANIVTPDGIGIVMASRLLAGKKSDPVISERVSGYDLLHALMQRANQHGWRVYLLGASPDANSGAGGRLREMYPDVQIVGSRDGYFSTEQEAEIVQEINETQPHMLFVALGAPRQEIWIAKYWDQLNVNVAMGVGGSFDVLAGKVKRAPKIWQKLNLEWLYRLLSQPSRWRRQLALPHFALLVLKERFFPKRS